MLLKPVHGAVKTAVMYVDKSVNTQLAAVHSVCGTTTTVTKLLTGTWKGRMRQMTRMLAHNLLRVVMKQAT